MRGVSCVLAIVGALAPLTIAFVVAGCGGGGGGSGSSAAPGTLAALALQGDIAPSTSSGHYGPFVPDMLLSAAEGGWVAFVADVSGGSTTRGLFVVQPDGTVALVFAVGDTVPPDNEATGMFSDFRRVWMRPNGVVIVDADVTAGTTRGLFSARGNGLGGVVERACVVTFGSPLPPVIGGSVNDLDEPVTEVADDGRVFFHATSTTLVHAIIRTPRNGAGYTPIVYTGQSTVLGTFGSDFSAVGMDSTGTFFVFASAVGGAAGEGIFATLDGVTFQPIVANTEVPLNSGGRPFADVFNGARLHVSWLGGSKPAFVTWRGTVSGAAPNSGVFRRAFWNGGTYTLGNIESVVGVAEPLAGVGAGAFAADAVVFDQQTGPFDVVFRTDVTGGSTAHVFARVIPTSGAIDEMFRSGTEAPGGSNFGIGYPSLSTTEINDAGDRLGSFAFSAILVGGSSGVFWDVNGVGRFALARQGAPAAGTGGATFGSFSAPSAVSAAVGNVAFRAALVGGAGASAVFRQH